MGFVRDSFGIHSGFIWDPFGIHSGFIRDSFGIHLGFPARAGAAPGSSPAPCPAARACPARCQPLSKAGTALPGAAPRILPPPKSHKDHLGRPRSPFSAGTKSPLLFQGLPPGVLCSPGCSCRMSLSLPACGPISICPHGFKCRAAPCSSCCCPLAGFGRAVPALSLPMAKLVRDIPSELAVPGHGTFSS